MLQGGFARRVPEVHVGVGVLEDGPHGDVVALAGRGKEGRRESFSKQGPPHVESNVRLKDLSV